MSSMSQSPSNVSAELQDLSIFEKVILYTLCTVPACVFLFINGVMLFTLRSKPVFCDTCRFILLFNLLLADTAQIAVSQVLFLLAASKITLTYPVCGTVTAFANITNVISPLTLVVMSIERCVAVCVPLRHTMIITIRNTRAAVVALWAFGSLHSLNYVFLMLDFPFEKLESLQMKNTCSNIAMMIGSKSDSYDKAFTGFLFILAGVVIISSYTGVIIAARSASTNKASVLKARNTLLLHLVQLSLSLSSTVYNPVNVLLIKMLARVVFVRLYIFLYVFIILFPRCLSSLIYGLRDQIIRPVLLQHLCCRLNVKVPATRSFG